MDKILKQKWILVWFWIFHMQLNYIFSCDSNKTKRKILARGRFKKNDKNKLGMKETYSVFEIIVFNWCLSFHDNKHKSKD